MKGTMCRVLNYLFVFVLLSQSTIFQSCWDGATVPVYCQGHIIAALVGVEPGTPRFGVRRGC